MKKLFLAFALLSIMTITDVYAQNLTERNNLPEWTNEFSLGVAFVSDSLDFNASGMDDIDSQGIQVEISKNYVLDEQFITQSALKGRLTSTGSEAIEIDNKSIGLTQRLIRKIPTGDMWLKPSLGLGINYGGIEYGPADDSDDQQYISYNGEVAMRLDTMQGIAPFVSYNYEIADRENTSDELNIQTFSVGIAAVF